jgi:PAS domain S-box-containing protein
MATGLTAMGPDLLGPHDGLNLDDFDVDMPLVDVDMSGTMNGLDGGVNAATPQSQPHGFASLQQQPPPPPQDSFRSPSHSSQTPLSTPVGPSHTFSSIPTSSAPGMNNPGAGPLPTGFGMQPGGASGSTLTEFTKRRNWSQRVLEELRDLLHILSADGRILYVSPSAKQLTGWDESQLIGKFMGEFIHQDDSAIFVREFNESIASGNALRFFYRFRKEDGSYGIFESHGHPHLSSEIIQFGNHAGSQLCSGFFMMSRPYPTKNAALLDSFLEHKIENEKLTKRIAELKREEQEEMDQQDRAWQAKKLESTATPSESRGTETQTTSDAASSAYAAMPPPAKPGISNTALTRHNLDEVLASSRPDSINDKMARFEGVTHYDTIEMLTGLRYRDGERSQGISTGDTSPALIRGDAGIAILVDKDNRGSSDKKKKLKVADEYVCTDCGTLDSPEWRKGPSGPKTLCNACGCKCSPGGPNPNQPVTQANFDQQYGGRRRRRSVRAYTGSIRRQRRPCRFRRI